MYLSYQDKRNNWTFERFLTVHKYQHIILEGLTDHRYCRLDARTRVHYLLNRIKTDSLDAVKVNIMQDRKLCRDFERCVTFYKDLLKHSFGNQRNKSRRVSEVGSQKKGTVSIGYWYYSKKY